MSSSDLHAGARCGGRRGDAASASRSSRGPRRLVERIGRLALASRPGTTLIRRLAAPVHRWLLRVSGGRLPLVGASRVLLLSVAGRRSGRVRTTPLFYVRDGSRLVVCNVRPAHERPNPWVANVREARRASIEIHGQRRQVHAREANAAEVARYWPRFLRLWPAYEHHYAASGERTLFVLEPSDASAR